MKKTAILILAILTLSIFAAPIVMAADTVLPSGAEQVSDSDCMYLIQMVNNYTAEERATFMGTDQKEVFLSCGIKTGNIHLWMLPFYVTHLIEFALGIAGIISVLFVMVGGYFYATGGLTEDKEKGKKTIMYALGGLALASFAWIIVNIIQVQLTS